MELVEVKAYSGYKADQKPRAFWLRGREFKVDEDDGKGILHD